MIFCWTLFLRNELGAGGLGEGVRAFERKWKPWTIDPSPDRRRDRWTTTTRGRILRTGSSCLHRSPRLLHRLRSFLLRRRHSLLHRNGSTGGDCHRVQIRESPCRRPRITIMPLGFASSWSVSVCCWCSAGYARFHGPPRVFISCLAGSTVYRRPMRPWWWRRSGQGLPKRTKKSASFWKVSWKETTTKPNEIIIKNNNINLNTYIYIYTLMIFFLKEIQKLARRGWNCIIL